MDKISVKMLQELKACKSVIKWFYSEYTIVELIEFTKKNNTTIFFDEFNWLISNCKICQTEEMLNFYKSLNPYPWDVRWIIIHCKFCQTLEMVKFYKSLNPYMIGSGTPLNL